MEAKEAFTVLSDAKARAEYDRRQQVALLLSSRCAASSLSHTSRSCIFPSAMQGGFDWSGLGDFGRQTWQRTTASNKTKQEQEEFYGFSEFFRDVEEEFSKRRRRGGREPGTLLEELAALGEGILEDFVEFLEKELGIPPEEGASRWPAVVLLFLFSSSYLLASYCSSPSIVHAQGRETQRQRQQRQSMPAGPANTPWTKRLGLSSVQGAMQRKQSAKGLDWHDQRRSRLRTAKRQSTECWPS